MSIGPRTWMTFAIALLLVACEEPAPEQPLAFNHSLHVGRRRIDCRECHAGAQEGVHAGLPRLRQCLACHMRPQGDPPSEREKVVRRMAAEGRELAWIQLTRNEGHVYFSHRAHVAIAGMRCVRCHGDVSTWEAPPTEPNEDLMSMDACMDCHETEGASNDCVVCHK